MHYGYKGFNCLSDFEGVVLDVGVHSGIWSAFDLCHNNIQSHILLPQQRISIVLFFLEFMNVIFTIC